MQTQTVRTTIDIKEDLTRKLKEYSVRHGLTQKDVISQAIFHYMGTKAQENDAKKLWAKMRKIASSGKQDVNLITELRKDRLR